MSAKRTLVELVSVEPVGGLEQVDLVDDSPLLLHETLELGLVLG